MSAHPSPLLQLPGAVADADTGIAWHYGDPMGEQRAAERGTILVDHSTREIVILEGPDRLDWLNKLTSQLLDPLPVGGTTSALLLSPQGHVEHHLRISALADRLVIDVEPGAAAALVEYLERMKFWAQVTITPEPELAMLSLQGVSVAETAHSLGLDLAAAGERGRGLVRPTATGVDVIVERAELAATAQSWIAAGARPAGNWAAEALRVARGEARFGVDTDERTIPNELHWLDDAVHLNKGCYRGQETVARVANLGRPPRRLVRLSLDGSQDVLPAPGEAVTTAAGRTVGRLGTVAQHHEDGPIALALIKRGIGSEEPLLAGGVDARIDPADVADDGPAPASAQIDRAAFAAVRRPR